LQFSQKLHFVRDAMQRICKKNEIYRYRNQSVDILRVTHDSEDIITRKDTLRKQRVGGFLHQLGH
jgi:hypothetical protein